MEWSKITVRKEIETTQNKTETSNEKFLRTTKLEFALKRSIKETRMFFHRMASERNEFTDETSTRNLSADHTLQQDRQDNLHPREVCIMIDNFERGNGDEEIQEAEVIVDCNTESENTDSPVHFNESLDYCVRNFTQSCNNSEIIKEVGDIHTKTNETINIYNIPASSVKMYEITETPQTLDKEVSSENKNCTLEKDITEADIMEKVIIHDPYCANIPMNEKNLLKIESEENIFSESDIFKYPGLSINVDENNIYDKSRKAKTGIKPDQKANIPLTKEEITKNNLKYCSPNLPQVKKEANKNDVYEETSSKSVTDLITYFETLNILNKSRLKLPNQKKSKVKSNASKQDLKNEQLMKFCFIQDVDHNANSQLLAPDISKHNINDTKFSTKATTEAIQPDMNPHARQYIQSPMPEYGPTVRGKGRRVRFEKNKVHLEGDASKIRERMFFFDDFVPNETQFSKVSNLRRFPCQRKPSPTAASRIPTSRKGKRLHFEEDETLSNGNAKKVKEHVFLFNDGVPNITQFSKVSNPRHFRSRFTQRAIQPQLHGGILNAKNRFNMPKETNVISNVVDANGEQNSTQKQQHEGNSRFFRNKSKASDDSMNTEIKVLILISVTLIIFGMIYCEIVECSNSSFYDILKWSMGYAKK